MSDERNRIINCINIGWCHRGEMKMNRKRNLAYIFIGSAMCFSLFVLQVGWIYALMVMAYIAGVVMFAIGITNLLSDPRE